MTKLTIAPAQWLESDTVFGGKRLDRVIARVGGYEIRHNITRRQIYIPAKPNKWPGRAALTINGVDYGAPDRIAGHGATWDDREIDLTRLPDAPGTEPTLLGGAGTKSDPAISTVGDPWASKPRTYDEAVSFMGVVFMGDSEPREHYFELKRRWYASKGPFGNREYPLRHTVVGGWKAVTDAKLALDAVVARKRDRLDELSGYMEALFREKQKAEAEQRRREAAERAKPVDLTDPQVKREYLARNARLLEEQRQNQERSLEIARSRLSQHLALPKDRQDSGELRSLRRTVERIEWELAGAPADGKPKWISWIS